ncbi:MAG: N-6 DNA methylase [Sedimentisphaerales bacterium]|nr:N-6 DNA methylase [Sedimentisphaerales bacterium]
MPVPDQVLKLVDTFDRNRSAYTSANYNETQLRHEFLDPFFMALGWDVNNTAGYAEAYKDVIHEDALKIGAATKSPDYCFRIGGTRKFFLEAKKPSVDIKNDIHPAFQLRRYAWSAKLPLSLLSDFEELAVYDCRIKPTKTDLASAARTMYYTFDQYPDRWDQIASIFSRDAVLQGSFDKYADSAKRKKGTAEVDTAFLAEIENWRNSIARNLARRNLALSNRELNFAVQLTIDRIIFLRICEDRGIEQYGQLQALLNGPNVYPRLLTLYERADERYNSGLFHFHPETNRPGHPDTLTPKLNIDDKLLKEIIKSLYYPDSPYEFAVLPAEILGHVYEQFLGKVITLTKNHQARIEEKPEVKKAGGVYYTPKYIVDYIVKNTVGKLLESRSLKSYKSRLPSLDQPLRILDPACGSGSFLIGAYQHLLDWHLEYYSNHDPDSWLKTKHPPIYESSSTSSARSFQLTTPERKRILLDHIFGVDIDSQAVEVTKLSLLLKVLEGESQHSLDNQLKLFHERALPDLADNIKCGNSLISPDFYQNQQQTMFDDEQQFKINAFDWHTEFPHIFNQNNPGFDIVIGNPPYGALFSDNEKKYLIEKYTCQSYQLDSYLLFLENSITSLLSNSGFSGMIIPNPWLTNLFQQNTRKFIVTNTKVVNIAHFKFPVFKKVTVDTQVVILQKSNPKNWHPLVTVYNKIDSLRELPGEYKPINIIHDQDVWVSLDGEVINIFLSPHEFELASKCKVNSDLLSNFCKINVGIKPYQTGKGKPPQTKDVVKIRSFDSDYPIDDSYRLYLRGADIKRYQISPIKPRYIKYGSWLAEPRPSADFDSPLKFFMRQTGDSLIAAIDVEKYLCLNNMHVLVPNENLTSPYYLLGIINSQLLNWYYQSLNPEVGEALAEVKKTNVAKLPIRKINFPNPTEKSQHDQMVSLVETMLQLNQSLAAAKTPNEKNLLQRRINSTDQQIDQLTYKLYNLNPDEIKIIEESSK